METSSHAREPSTDAEKLKTYEEALDKALRLLGDRFDDVDQSAAVRLADSLYSLQERERFESRERGGDMTPYRA